MLRIVAILALAPLLVACAGTGATTPEGPALAIVNLTHGPEDAHRAWMGLRLAEHLRGHGRDVIVFMNVTAPPLAGKSLGEDVKFADMPAFREQVTALMASGVKILVCAECAKKMGVGAEDLLPGAAFADRDSLFGGLDARAVVFSY